MFNFYKKLFGMATRKRKTRKRKSSLRSGALMSAGKRRTTRRKTKSGLSEAFSPAQATASAKTMLGGAMGGFGYGIIKPSIDNATENKLAQNGIVLALSFVASAVLKMDSVSSGIAGAWGHDMSKTFTGLNDMNDHDYADSDSLDEDDEFMDEDGNPMYLADDGEFYYMDEMNEDDSDSLDEMNDSPVYLADASLYPEYVNVSNY
jgi:hypothetical protein